MSGTELALFDSIDLGAIPPHAPAVAGYVDGRWPTFHQLRERWPNALLLSIAVQPDADADALDVERGDARPEDAASWLLRQMNRGVVRPVLYASVSAMQALIEQVLERGVPRQHFRLWTAHYTGRRHRCSPSCGLGFRDHAGATQWTDRSHGRNLDESQVMNPLWFPHVRH